MRIKIFILALILGISTANISCDKDTLGSMSATIDGAQWEATIASVIAADYGEYITLVGFDLNTKKVFISIKASSTGTYNLQVLESQTETYALYLKSKDDESDGTKKYVSTTGTVTITKLADKKISGTFTFTAANSLEEVIEITNGKFDNVPIL